MRFTWNFEVWQHGAKFAGTHHDKQCAWWIQIPMMERTFCLLAIDLTNLSERRKTVTYISYNVLARGNVEILKTIYKIVHFWTSYRISIIKHLLSFTVMLEVECIKCSLRAHSTWNRRCLCSFWTYSFFGMNGILFRSCESFLPFLMTLIKAEFEQIQIWWEGTKLTEHSNPVHLLWSPLQ